VGGNFQLREPINLESELLSSESIADADCVVIVTAHHDMDVDLVVEHSKVVVDTVNATRGRDSGRGNIVRLGAASNSSR
jgi:UDP-N-acetyl-D-glucosamine dehydrogenase